MKSVLFFFFFFFDRPTPIVNDKKKLGQADFFFIFTSPTDRLDQISSWKIRHPGNQLTMALGR